MNVDELTTVIRGWIKYSDPDVVSDDLILSWIRWGEERINAELRVKEQLDIDTANIVNSRVMVPNDWISNDFMRIIGVGPIHYIPRDEFYDKNAPTGKYTTSGKFLMIGGKPNVVEGRDVELHYFADVPPLGNESNWLTLKYPSLITAACLVPAFMYLEAPERAGVWEAGTTQNIQKLNASYKASKGSGSKLTVPRSRSLG